jgi:hypothetical protein
MGLDFDERNDCIDLVPGNFGFKLFRDMRCLSIAVDYLVWERVDSM